MSGFFALPYDPGFPLYGLASTFTGDRWMGLWDEFDHDESGSIRHVDLGHGDETGRGPSVTVSSDPKLPYKEMPGGSWGIGPTGIDDRAFVGVLWAFARTYPRSRPWSGPAGNRAAAELDEVNRSGDRQPPEWQPEDVTVEGDRVEFAVRRIGDAWVAVAGLGDVALGLWGHGIDLHDHEIVRMETLDGYAIRPGSPAPPPSKGR